MDVDCNKASGFRLQDVEVLQTAIFFPLLHLRIKFLADFRVQRGFLFHGFTFVHRKMFLDRLVLDEMQSKVVMEGIDRLRPFLRRASGQYCVAPIDSTQVSSYAGFMCQLHGRNIAASSKRVHIFLISWLHASCRRQQHQFSAAYQLVGIVGRTLAFDCWRNPTLRLRRFFARHRPGKIKLAIVRRENFLQLDTNTVWRQKKSVTDVAMPFRNTGSVEITVKSAASAVLLRFLRLGQGGQLLFPNSIVTFLDEIQIGAYV
mmetsp:Transcript_27607/g.42505  ORF Transcript_27607/g.42505 Transcript_27607/m.42505 type:complete len:260 (+) Transcript_27607:2960-3739(+)